MAKETAKRLQPKGNTLRELFLKSGNFCAFPGCTRLIMDADGTFVGEVCHIEAAEKGGERFNAGMTNEQRRAFENLMLMCHDHHKTTDDVGKFSVERLRQMKADHENRFATPERAILAGLRDWTSSSTSTKPTSFARFNAVTGAGSDDDAIPWISTLADKLEKVPVEVRAAFGEVVLRLHKMRHTNVVRGPKILCHDIAGALRLEPQRLQRLIAQFESYELAYLDEMETDFGQQPAIKVRALNGWDFWMDIAEFCVKAAEPIEAFTVDLDFARLSNV